ncbi:MAG: helix-turn-helix domain-containing protein [Chthoniobacter sp.]
MRKTFRLKRPEVAAAVAARWREAGSAREMERLAAVRLALQGASTLEEIARSVGRGRSTVAEWMRVVREEGLEALLGRHQGRGRAPQVCGAALRGLRKGVRRGRWKRAVEVQAWLQARHGLELSLNGTRYWLKKAGAS